jgi:hypothetical protein
MLRLFERNSYYSSWWLPQNSRERFQFYSSQPVIPWSLLQNHTSYRKWNFTPGGWPFMSHTLLPRKTGFSDRTIVSPSPKTRKKWCTIKFVLIMDRMTQNHSSPCSVPGRVILFEGFGIDSRYWIDHFHHMLSHRSDDLLIFYVPPSKSQKPALGSLSPHHHWFVGRVSTSLIDFRKLGAFFDDLMGFHLANSWSFSACRITHHSKSPSLINPEICVSILEIRSNIIDDFRFVSQWLDGDSSSPFGFLFCYP